MKKFYVHLYDQNQIRMDWQQPLAHFGGRTAIEVTTDAFRYHASQVRRGWGMDRTEGYDNDLFGLYYTAVGPDVIKNDLMENIQQ